MPGGFQKCVVDHSVFYKKTACGCVLFAVYVNDILITGSDKNDIEEIKEHLRTHFVTKDMGKLRYFLDIDLLQETGLLGCKPESTPIE